MEDKLSRELLLDFIKHFFDTLDHKSEFHPDKVVFMMPISLVSIFDCIDEFKSAEPFNMNWGYDKIKQYKFKIDKYEVTVYGSTALHGKIMILPVQLVFKPYYMYTGFASQLKEVTDATCNIAAIANLRISIGSEEVTDEQG